ncbi:MAG: hypothetical protein J0L99_20475 [Chitinophagales bacterium]|nr:hypothetical protein [Chitinophagales bacterium]
MKAREDVIDGVKKCAIWWIGQRRAKLEEQLSETMSVNPFMMPFLFDYHDLKSFEELAELIIASHLMTGHSTGFGKLIDEKILPEVFGTKKLDASFRKNNKPFSYSCFDEIDHLIDRKNGVVELLSLKAGKWTIQLTMAVQLNKAFKEITETYPGLCNNIVVGVFYGKPSDLTDKYDILRGINRGANHDVTDLQKHVIVYSGRDFWKWLNYGEENTQEWVLQGLLNALQETKIHITAKELLQRYKESVVTKYQDDILEEDGSINWFNLLKRING